MKKGLLTQAVVKFLCGLVLVSVLLFLPAGTLKFNNAWLLLELLFIPMFIAGLILFQKSPVLLQKRLIAREKDAAQKSVVLLSGLQFLVCFVLAGLDFRFGWSHFPAWLTAAAVVLFLAGYCLYGEVLRENAYLSRTIEVQENQKVIDTGLYAIVRHPMYFATVLLFLAIPLVLGSWPAFLVMLPYPLLLVKRISNEERVPSDGLTGYRDYKKKVRYRLLPFLW